MPGEVPQVRGGRGRSGALLHQVRLPPERGGAEVDRTPGRLRHPRAEAGRRQAGGREPGKRDPTAVGGAFGGMRLPDERVGRPAPPEIAARRQGMAEALAAGTWTLDVPPVVETLGGVRSLRFHPPAESRATVLHFHGGGYRIGCPEMVGAFAAALAARCGVE